MNKDTDQTEGRTNQADIRIFPNADCRFAYTINNAQPVRCSFISDQPLFFADFEAAIEDETENLEDPVFKALEKEILDLKNKTTAYEKLSREFIEPVSRKHETLLSDLDYISAPQTAKAADLSVLNETLSLSRTASSMMTLLQQHGVQLVASTQVLDAFYDRDGSVILVRGDLDFSHQILVTTRELRRAYQHKTGSGLHPLLLHPDHAVLVNRAQQTDLAIAMVRTAWELQLAGHKEAWTRVENSTLADLGRAFAREACNDFRSLNNGTAAYACFEAWFLSERCRKADRNLVQQMLADYNGYVFSDNSEASRMIAFDILVALGKMPFGENYIARSIPQIMADSVFTDVRDRSNANFLWFIKFERSFKDAEAELGKTSSTSSVKMVKLDTLKADKPTADIIPMPVRETLPTRRVAQSGGADVVSFILPH